MNLQGLALQGSKSTMPSTSSGNLPEVFLVDDLRVDVGQQRVTRAGQEIRLPNLSLQMLLALVRAAPNVLSNDVLVEIVWPGLVVSPETVSKRVNLLREALGDSAQEPRYVTGVRSRGYRLVATVSREAVPATAEAVPVEAVAAAVPIAGMPRGKRRLYQTGFVVVVLVALVMAFSTIRSHRAHEGTGMHEANARPGAAPASADVRERTVAVMPFESISADAADAYLAQGLPEMILNRLSRVEGLSVIARNSSFVVDTRRIDSREIGRRLNSGYLISGSVQRESDRLRVTVHLVDSSAGTLVWSAHFDRRLHDIFRIEDEIADQLAAALSARIGAPGPVPPPGRHSTNLEAYLAYLQGRTLLGRLTVVESETAVPYFEKAIALDPGFASAYASLYDARMQAADQRREDMRLARKRYQHLIDRAIELDPNLGAAYFARAMWAEVPHDAGATADNPMVLALDRDYRQGAELDPSNGRGLEAYAEFLHSILERKEEAERMLRRALWVDPMSPSAHFLAAEFSFDDFGVTASEQKTLQVLELDPNFVPALQRYGKLRWLIDGRLAEAVQVMEHGMALDPHNSLLSHGAMAAYLDLGDVKAARAVVAGTPHSARATGLLTMYEGDWRRAGLSAYDEEGWTRDSDYCELWQSDALRDYALKTGELDRAIAFISSKYYLADDPAAHLDACNRGAAVHLSELLAAAGRSTQAMALRRAVSTWIDAGEAMTRGDSRRLRAGILLLDGKQDAALAELAQSFRAGFYARWWYTIEYDPLWQPLHKDPRFQAIAAEVRRYVDAQRTELEALRRQGAVPKREYPAIALKGGRGVVG